MQSPNNILKKKKDIPKKHAYRTVPIQSPHDPQAVAVMAFNSFIQQLLVTAFFYPQNSSIPSKITLYSIGSAKIMASIQNSMFFSHLR